MSFFIEYNLLCPLFLLFPMILSSIHVHLTSHFTLSFTLMGTSFFTNPLLIMDPFKLFINVFIKILFITHIFIFDLSCGHKIFWQEMLTVWISWFLHDSVANGWWCFLTNRWFCEEFDCSLVVNQFLKHHKVISSRCSWISSQTLCLRGFIFFSLGFHLLQFIFLYLWLPARPLTRIFILNNLRSGQQQQVK